MECHCHNDYSRGFSKMILDPETVRNFFSELYDVAVIEIVVSILIVFL